MHKFTAIKWEKERKRYEEEEPLAKSKSWEEFLELAVSYQCLEGRGANAKLEIRQGDQLLSKTRLKPNSYMGFGKRQNPDLDLAIANLERRAQRHAEKSKAELHRHTRRHRGEDDVPRGSGKCREITVMQSHHLRCHQADEEDAEPRRGSQPSLTAEPTRRPHMPSIYEEEVHRTPLKRISYGPAPPQEYVYPPPSHQSLGGSTLIGSGYSSYAHDSFYDGPRVAGSGRDSLADGGSRDGSQRRRSGVSRESTRSGCSAYTDDERRDQEATEA